MNALAAQTEDGPPPPRGELFRPGETVFFSFQVSGYRESPLKKFRLSYSVEAFDPRGTRIAPPAESILDGTLHPEDKQWMPKVRVPVAIPAAAPGGTYTIKAALTDDISHLAAAAETTFSVEGHDTPPAPDLLLREFNFYGAEEDTRPLPVAAFHPGGTVFARFEIAGFRYGRDNTVDVYYDVAVLNSAGKRIYEQLHAAGDRGFSYYPKPFVPGQMSLSLTPDVRPGEYTVLITAHDETGHQQAEIKKLFLVE